MVQEMPFVFCDVLSRCRLKLVRLEGRTSPAAPLEIALTEWLLTTAAPVPRMARFAVDASSHCHSFREFDGQDDRVFEKST